MYNQDLELAKYASSRRKGIINDIEDDLLKIEFGYKDY